MQTYDCWPAVHVCEICSQNCHRVHLVSLTVSLLPAHLCDVQTEVKCVQLCTVSTYNM